MFIPAERWTLIQKLVERKVFLMKSKHQYYLSQWGESVYGAQSWKKWDYYVNPCLSKSVNDKNGRNRAFHMKPKH